MSQLFNYEQIDDTPRFNLGYRSADSHTSNVYVYVKCGSDIPAYSVCMLAGDHLAVLLRQSTARQGSIVGVTGHTTMRDRQYGWVLVYGIQSVRAQALSTADAFLHTTNMPGVVDTAGDSADFVIEGLTLRFPNTEATVQPILATIAHPIVGRTRVEIQNTPSIATYVKSAAISDDGETLRLRDQADQLTEFTKQEQRVLVDQQLGVVNKFDFVEKKPYTTRNRVIREATPRSATWTVYTHAQYLGVLQSGEPTGEGARILGNWFFHGRLHIPIRYEERVVDGASVPDWYDTSIEQVIPGNFYLGDFPNNATATSHATGNDDIYYDYTTHSLKQSSHFVNGHGQLLAPTRHRLLDTEDIEHTLATKDEISAVFDPPPYGDIDIIPRGVAGKDLPAEIVVVLTSVNTSKTIQSATLTFAGFTTKAAVVTTIPNGGRVCTVTLTTDEIQTLANNIDDTEVSIDIALLVTYTDAPTYSYNNVILVNNPAFASGGAPVQTPPTFRSIYTGAQVLTSTTAWRTMDIDENIANGRLYQIVLRRASGGADAAYLIPATFMGDELRASVLAATAGVTGHLEKVVLATGRTGAAGARSVHIAYGDPTAQAAAPAGKTRLLVHVPGTVNYAAADFRRLD